MEMLTDEEIYAAIRYLDPGSAVERHSDENGAVIGICVSLILLTAYIAFICLYHRAP